MANYLRGAYAAKRTKQSEAIPGREQEMVANNAGGFGFQVDDWKRLERFLVLGSEGGTYYVSEQKLTKDNAQGIVRCLKADGKKTVDTIVAISDQGRAPKNDPALFALAMAASPKFATPETNHYALDNLQKVARTGTHLFHFTAFADEMRGWGRGLKGAVGRWYTDKPADRLAYQLVKYQGRDGWTHRDLLRLAHTKSLLNPAASYTDLFKWVVKGEGLPADSLLIHAFEQAKTADKATVVKLIQQHGLTREMIPTEMLKEKEVWEALLVKMPLTAMIRNLGNMSKVGLLEPFSEAAKTVVERLQNQELLRKARVHPVGVLLALKTYGGGKGYRGKGEWKVVPQVLEALDEAFYLSFENAPVTNKRYYIGVDVSGSMSSEMMGTNLRACEGAGVMAMTTVRKEPWTYVAGFANTLREIHLTKTMRLDTVAEKCVMANFGSTDCGQPMIDAAKRKIPVDVFVVITDNETWVGQIHPTQALQDYRQKMGIAAKEVVVGMTSAGFTIADPQDAGQLDVVGFDTTVPLVMADFATDGQVTAEKEGVE